MQQVKNPYIWESRRETGQSPTAYHSHRNGHATFTIPGTSAVLLKFP